MGRHSVHWRKQQTLPYILLGVAAVFLCWLFVGRIGIFGSKVDWISQHSVLPEYFRQQFYDTGELFPDFALNLGGGQNIYNFSYYGLYSPVVLLSYLFPFLKMEAYLMGASILSLAASVLLFYFWMKRKAFDSGIGVSSSLLLLLAAPMIYQSYNQVMFVNYMPFLCLAFLGADRYFEKKKAGLYTISVFLMIMTSFYFSVGGMLALVLYGVHQYLKHAYDEGRKVTVGSFFAEGVRYLVPLLTAVFMSGVLLIPTAMALMGGRGEASGVSLGSLLIPQAAVMRFSYHPYGIGLTTLGITVLVTGLFYRRAYERVLTYGCVVILTVPLFSYLLNGGLYIRDKAFIPFLPVLCYLVACYLEKMKAGELSFFQGAVPYGITLLLILAGRDDIRIGKGVKDERVVWALLAEGVLLFVCFLLFWKKRRAAFLTVPSIVLLFVFGLWFNQVSGRAVEDEFYGEITEDSLQEAVEELTSKEDGLYRMEQFGDERENAANLNRIWDSGQYISSIYSSTYNAGYQEFRQKVFQVEEPFRNAMMQSVSANPVFRQLMGVKYILSKEEVPGCRLYRKAGDVGIYENPYAAPVAYVTDRTMSEEEYRKLSFPYNQSALMEAVVTKGGGKAGTKAEKSMEIENSVKRVELTEDRYEVHAKEKTEYTLEIPMVTEENQVLYLQFDVKNERRSKDVAIWCEGVRNKLTARSHIYYNDNTTFTYAVSLKEGQEQIRLTLGAGDYSLENICCYIGSMEKTDGQSALQPDKELTKGNRIKGKVTADSDGYFVTSIPYDRNFTVRVDGKEVKPERVNLAFLGFPIEKGSHEIEMIYHAPGKQAGLLCSAAGILFFFFPILYKSRKRLYNKNITQSEKENRKR